MSDADDYILDIDGLSDAHQSRVQPVAASAKGRPWLSVHWKCCQVYSRIYRNRQGDAYTGTCPRCGKPVKAQVASHGTHARFFEAW